MQPILSLKAHYHTWLSKHYQFSLSGHRLKQLYNCHQGQRCFIVANGPSLRAEDLDLLWERNEITFGMNRIYKIFSQTDWRPTYYACEDEKIALEHQPEISAIPAKIKFIPAELKWYYGIIIENALYFHFNCDKNTSYPFCFSTNINKQIDGRGTVTFTCMQLAAYMGFSEIYLLGVDHNYQKTIDINGNVVVDPNAKDYFCEGYDSDIKDVVVHDMGNNTRAYMDAKKYCDSTSGKVTIYNATRGGKLEVFQRVDFASLFPQEKNEG